MNPIIPTRRLTLLTTLVPSHQLLLLVGICLLAGCTGPVASRQTLQSAIAPTGAAYSANNPGLTIRGQQPEAETSNAAADDEPAVNPRVILRNAADPEGRREGGGIDFRDRTSDDSLDKVSPLWDPHAPLNIVPFDVHVEEARTGRVMFGAGYNSDLGVTGNVMIDERNFDYTRLPRSLAEVVDGRALRGAGQGFRLELVPGEFYERYSLMFSDPYWRGTNLSMNVNAYYVDRLYVDWDEHRTGGRVSWGYRLTHDLSVSTALRAENVKVRRPRVLGVPELDAVLGDNELFSGRVALAHDTRDVPFMPTEGHLFEISYEQVFGSFDYPRGEVDFRKYFLVKERADGSGRRTLSYSLKLGISGSQTPLFENYFAGGFSTIRGFDFRGASPKNNGVVVGGELRFLGSVEYMVPLTGDDMLRGVFFTDFGTVEEELTIHGEDFRVTVGFGLRLAIPMMGPAPLALDLGVPLMREDGDEIENFSFFFGFGRM